MSAKHERNDGKVGWDPARARGGKRFHGRPGRASEADARDWVWGVHAVEAGVAGAAGCGAARLRRRRGSMGVIIFTARKGKGAGGHDDQQ